LRFHAFQLWISVELRHLRYFVAVAEERHFTRAASRLRIAQPALSRQIRDLEEELGCALLDRQARNITLTASGEALLEEARKLLSETERLKETAKRAANGQTGYIAVGYVSWIAPKFFFPLFRNIREKHPGLEIDLLEMPPLDQIQALANDRLHLGFAKFLVTHAPEGVHGQPISQHRMWAILPEGHPKICRNRPIPLHSLASEPFIFVRVSQFSGYFQWIQNECIRAGFTPKIVRTIEHPQTALDLVCAGVGISLLSLPQDQPLDRPGVVAQALAPPVPTFTQNVFYKAAHLKRYPAVPLLLDQILKAAKHSKERYHPLPAND
jgi:DNA-binding transcriptional LysR family regulator